MDTNITTASRVQLPLPKRHFLEILMASSSLIQQFEILKKIFVTI
jgi:hypothetical protein